MDKVTLILNDQEPWGAKWKKHRQKMQKHTKISLSSRHFISAAFGTYKKKLLARFLIRDRSEMPKILMGARRMTEADADVLFVHRGV